MSDAVFAKVLKQQEKEGMSWEDLYDEALEWVENQVTVFVCVRIHGFETFYTHTAIYASLRCVII